MDLTRAEIVGRFEKDFVDPRCVGRDMTGGDRIPFNAAVDILIKRTDEMFYIVVDRPGGIILPIPIWEVAEFYGIKEPNDYNVINYISELKIYWRTARKCSDNPQHINKFKRYEYLEILDEGSDLADMFSTQWHEELLELELRNEAELNTNQEE